MRIKPVLLAVVFAALTRAQHPALEVRFIGNMAFAISDGHVTLTTSPASASTDAPPRASCRGKGKH